MDEGSRGACSSPDRRVAKRGHGSGVGHVDQVDVDGRRSAASTAARARSARSASRPTRCTVAPSAARAVAAASPIPEVAPVTTTTRPSMVGGTSQASSRLRSAMPARLKLGATVASATASTPWARDRRPADRGAHVARAARSPAAARSPMRRKTTPMSGLNAAAIPFGVSVAS